ncbi:uncharacterized protein LOC117229493 [Megalopta genalis]|uniref:uncharacterized protein LOC117229493 n=1 Tax=Megalopta genalis TaxID=115081 RepID=UPI001442E625|nr:uncharacterized protein LOC117229493 [Megalopta genalis]
MSAAENYYATIVLFVLTYPSFSAMVLPRPPSSPNHIPQDQGLSDRKIYEGKALQSYLQSSNVERPNTNDYSFLEIELQSRDDLDPANLQNIVHAMLKPPEQVQNDSYPNPEVIPHSIFGVRDFGLSPSFKLKMFDEDKHVLMEPPKLQNYNEKLYYLKNNRPKVYVNVRGHSGSFRKDPTTRTTSGDDSMEFLRVTPYLQRQVDWRSHTNKKSRLPKKFDRRVDHASRKNLSRTTEKKKLSRLASVYGADDSTTENSMVTSSELPKQIPAPPSKVPSRSLMTQTTPVQRYSLRRTDILPGYSFPDA